MANGGAHEEHVAKPHATHATTSSPPTWNEFKRTPTSTHSIGSSGTSLHNQRGNSPAVFGNGDEVAGVQTPPSNSRHDVKIEEGRSTQLESHHIVK